MDFNNFYMSGNRNKYPVQTSCLLIYFICDVNVRLLSRKLMYVAGKFFKVMTEEDKILIKNLWESES